MPPSSRTLSARAAARSRFIAGTADMEAADRYRALACKSTDPERIAEMLHRAEESALSSRRNFNGQN
jgi:hypothetical protein